ncbi:hypothetical protein CHS0354_033536 [Potamilus streckersoni]|uniref:G-patch domain-containing protein n=1 Tax=Potamilus streckersoni TaxID=2493646 RepID=A0AAE0T090_9BIVA|nr:hypothetical protein CHS0354_033536 [Potamilus streckersoni]
MSGQNSKVVTGVGYVGTSYKDKMKQMTEQERIIEEKRRQIIQKMEAEQKKNVVQANPINKPQLNKGKVKTPPVPKTSGIFVNDGNFLERFKQLQGIKTGTPPAQNSKAESEDKAEGLKEKSKEETPDKYNKIVKEEKPKTFKREERKEDTTDTLKEDFRRNEFRKKEEERYRELSGERGQQYSSRKCTRYFEEEERRGLGFESQPPYLELRQKLGQSSPFMPSSLSPHQPSDMLGIQHSASQVHHSHDPPVAMDQLPVVPRTVIETMLEAPPGQQVMMSGLQTSATGAPPTILQPGVPVISGTLPTSQVAVSAPLIVHHQPSHDQSQQVLPPQLVSLPSTPVAVSVTPPQMTVHYTISVPSQPAVTVAPLPQHSIAPQLIPQSAPPQIRHHQLQPQQPTPPPPPPGPPPGYPPISLPMVVQTMPQIAPGQPVSTASQTLMNPQPPPGLPPTHGTPAPPIQMMPEILPPHTSHFVSLPQSVQSLQQQVVYTTPNPPQPPVLLPQSAPTSFTPTPISTSLPPHSLPSQSHVPPIFQHTIMRAAVPHPPQPNPQPLMVVTMTTPRMETSAHAGLMPPQALHPSQPLVCPPFPIKQEPHHFGEYGLISVKQESQQMGEYGPTVSMTNSGGIGEYGSLNMDEYGHIPIKKEQQKPVSMGNYIPMSIKKEQEEAEYDPAMPTDGDSPVKELPEDMKDGVKSAGSNSSGFIMGLKKQSHIIESKIKRENLNDAFDIEESIIEANSVKPVSPPEDPQLRDVIDKLTACVADSLPGLELKVMEVNRDNPAYWFLYDTSSPANHYYRYKLQTLRENKKKLEGNEADVEDNEAGEGSQKGVKRKRKSRWGPQDDTVPIGAPVIAVPPVVTANIQLGAGTVAAAVQAASRPPVVTLQDFARRMVGSDTLNDDQIKQIKEQQELNMMYELILAQKKAKEAALMADCPGINVKPKYEYDSDEDVDGGTWEHKKRMMEMEATRDWADQLTQMGRGKHFIGDFLPPDELEKFMETYKALKEGREPDLSDYKEFKLTCENVGYQMLQKLGWKEGEGLGSEGQGIKAPVNKGNVSVEGRGLGIERPDGLSRDDDEYDAFRKRMMLAYRFRPNPLNNPRRPYY